MAKPLAERLKAALGPTARASDVSDLIATISADLDVAKADQARFHAIAIDCSSDEKAADDAADAEHRASRRITRLEGQGEQLRHRLSQIVESDKRLERERQVAAVTAERDQLADDIRTLWPRLMSDLVPLLARIKANDTAISKLNVGLQLASAEAVARGCTPLFMHNGAYVPRMVDMQVPAMDVSAQPATHPWAWPPAEATPGNMMAACFDYIAKAQGVRHL